ncbi:MAG: four helix bundle protein [Acidobacteria bacterium]|nr:four helix bundle protein [Acidobacteriota bacterium]
MAKLRRFEEMGMWISARELVQNIYVVSRNPSFYRDYGLRDQIRRASISIASNIAEGFESQSNPIFCRFLSSARGSAAEVRAQLYLALDLGYLSSSDFARIAAQAESISRQITGFMNYLKKLPHRK